MENPSISTYGFEKTAASQYKSQYEKILVYPSIPSMSGLPVQNRQCKCPPIFFMHCCSHLRLLRDQLKRV